MYVYPYAHLGKEILRRLEIMCNKQNKNNKLQLYIMIICIAILLIIPLLHISVRNLPYIYNDEFGYWASAARFYGLDWSAIFSDTPYYSYGYGLILTLLLFIVGSTSAAYKAAVVLNGIWLALTFIFLNESAKILYPKCRKELLMVIAFVATLFSGNVVEANYTWPETFLFCLFCCVFYVLLSVLQRASCLKMLGLSLMTAYIYFVHQRTLGIVLAITIVVLLMLFMKKITLKHVICYVLPLILLFLIGNQIKSFVINEVWNNSGSVARNDFSGVSRKIKLIFEHQGLKKLILALLGKMYYVFASNFFLVPFSACIMVQWVYSAIRKKQQTVNCVAGVFLLLALLFSLGINSVYMITPANVTHIVYGRYIDNVVGPFVLIGLLSLFDYKINWFKNVCIIGVFAFLSYAVHYNLQEYDLYHQAAINNAGIAYMVDNGHIELVKGFVFVVGVWFAILLIKKLITKKVLAITSVSVFLLAVFLAVGQKTYNKFEMDWSEASQSSMYHAQMIRDLSNEYGDLEIYAILNVQGDFPGIYSGNGIQFLLQDQKIQYVHIDDVESQHWPDNAVILSHNSLGELEGFKMISVDGVYELLVSESVLK